MRSSSPKDELLDANYEALVGPLVTHQEVERAIDLTWKNGFFASASFRVAGRGYDRADPVAILSDLLASPSALFLDEIVIETLAADTFGEFYRLLVDAKPPPPLRTLRILKGR